MRRIGAVVTHAIVAAAAAPDWHCMDGPMGVSGCRSTLALRGLPVP